jgi:hypothetical protein
MFKTEFQDALPCGFLDEDGTLHREITMRRATAADEILPLKDPRVVRNPGYLVIILLSRVITRLGSVEQINPNVIERLFATDLAHLQNLYNQINQIDGFENTVVCPHCQHEFMPQGGDSGAEQGTEARVNSRPGDHVGASSQRKANGAGG